MNLKISYCLDVDGKSYSFYHTEFTEKDLQEWLENKLENHEIPCPIHLDRDSVSISSVNVDSFEL